MQMRANLASLLTGLFVSVTITTAQTGNRKSGSSANPCPGGTGTAELSTFAVPSLEQLVRASQLIVAGTVVKVLLAFNPNPDHLNSTETDSLVSITDLLYGAPPLGTSTVTLTQIGGKVGPCEEVVPADPLVTVGEQYILFLRADDRKNVPNSSGSPRYYSVGVWSGKAKLVNGKVRFLPAANAGLHKYDNTDESAFITTLKDRINVLWPATQP